MEMAAWRLMRSHPAAWPSGDAIVAILGRRKRTDEENAPFPGAIGELIATSPDALSPKQLVDASREIDATSGEPELASVARIALDTLISMGRMLEPDRSPAAAQLARSVAGAYREMRDEIPLWDLVQLQSSGSLRGHWKTLESWQDVLLAAYRDGHWSVGRAIFDTGMARLATCDEHSQKRWEITQQLQLGYAGGLVLQAERLLTSPRVNDADRAHAGVLLRQAVSLIRGRDGDRDWDCIPRSFEHIRDARSSYATSPSNPLGAAPEEEREDNVLRYNERWHVMPEVIRLRALVAHQMIGARHGVASLDDRLWLEHAKLDLQALAERSEVTVRHGWEIERIRITADLLSGEDHGPERVAAVLAHGDDGGDYICRIAHWQSKMMVSESAKKARSQIVAELQRPAIRPPRLPDLAALA